MRDLAHIAQLVLVLDDLQWADLGSISLLFHLGRHLDASRILIICVYRREDVALGREGGRHPLEAVINELQRSFGIEPIDLDQTQKWDFVESLIDREPNRLDLGFREMIFQQTRGQALFTVELLRGMQERGELIQDAAGRPCVLPAWRENCSRPRWLPKYRGSTRSSSWVK